MFAYQFIKLGKNIFRKINYQHELSWKIRCVGQISQAVKRLYPQFSSVNGELLTQLLMLHSKIVNAVKNMLFKSPSSKLTLTEKLEVKLVGLNWPKLLMREISSKSSYVSLVTSLLQPDTSSSDEGSSFSNLKQFIPATTREQLSYFSIFLVKQNNIWAVCDLQLHYYNFSLKPT